MKKRRTKPTLRARRIQRLRLLEDLHAWYLRNGPHMTGYRSLCRLGNRAKAIRLEKIKWRDMPAAIDKLNCQLFGLSYATLEKLKRV